MHVLLKLHRSSLDGLFPPLQPHLEYDTVGGDWKICEVFLVITPIRGALLACGGRG